MADGRSIQRITAAERRAEIVKLRSAGYTFPVIAARLGYSDPSHVSRAFRQALRELPARDLDDIRAESAMRLESAMETLAKVISDPPPLFSAQGRIITDANGDPIPDKSVVVRATAEYRKCDESHRRLTGADQPVKKKLPEDEAMRRIREWAQNLEHQHRTITGQTLFRDTPQTRELLGNPHQDQDSDESTWSPW